MGKPFISELQQLEETYSAVLSMDTASLQDVLSESARYPLIAVGSGGSLSAAHFACSLHERFTGKLTKSFTPLEIMFMLSDVGTCRDLLNSAVLCLSAGGTTRTLYAKR